jgi:hypothetical protein
MQRVIFHFRVGFSAEAVLCCTFACDEGRVLNGSLNGIMLKTGGRDELYIPLTRSLDFGKLSHTPQLRSVGQFRVLTESINQPREWKTHRSCRLSLFFFFFFLNQCICIPHNK